MTLGVFGVGSTLGARREGHFYTTRVSARHVQTGSSIPRTTLTSWTDRLAITNDTAAILAKILQKRASGGRWRPNRKWKYGGDRIFRLSDPDFLFDFPYIMGSISNRYIACIRESICIAHYVNISNALRNGTC